MTSAPVDAAGATVSGRSLFLELHLERDTHGVAKVGFYFARKAPPSTLESVSGRAARNGQARARGRLVLKNDLTIWALNPWRTPTDGSLEVSAVRPDGARRT